MDEAIVERLTMRAYDPPLADRKGNGQIRDLSDPVNIGLLILAFENEVMMNGIADFFGNQAGTYADEIVSALEAVGCSSEAAVWSEVIAVATAAGMTHAAIQADRGQLPAGSITSFKALHGDKWRAALDETYRLVESIEFDRVSAALERYAQAHRAAFEAVLKS